MILEVYKYNKLYGTVLTKLSPYCLDILPVINLWYTKLEKVAMLIFLNCACAIFFSVLAKSQWYRIDFQVSCKILNSSLCNRLGNLVHSVALALNVCSSIGHVEVSSGHSVSRGHSVDTWHRGPDG